VWPASFLVVDLALSEARTLKLDIIGVEEITLKAQTDQVRDPASSRPIARVSLIYEREVVAETSNQPALRQLLTIQHDR
jgi:hypothetical protein